MQQTLYQTIPLSSRVSSYFALKGTKITGLWAPVVTSGQAYLLGSFDTTSKNFVRVWRADGSSSWAWNVGAGSKCVAPDVMGPILHGKIETQNAQSAVRTFVITTKFYQR